MKEKKEYQYATGTAPTPQQRWWPWRDNLKSRSEWRRQAPGLTMTRKSTHDDDGMTRWTMGTCSELLLTMTPALTSTRLVSTTHHAQQPTWTPTAQRWAIAQCMECKVHQGSDECTVLAPRWCVVYGIVVCIFSCGTFVNTLGVVFSYECGVCGWE